MIGSGNVEKVDANTLTLTGNNSYTGDTTLRNGTTLVAAGATLGVENSNATLTVQNGAKFATAGTVYNNITILSGGTLAAWNAIEGNATLRDAGIDTINGNVTNSGTLLLSAADHSVGNDFTITGDYTGAEGSQIVLNSELGTDTAPTDHLTITGSSFGQSGVTVSNMGGLGAQTVNGMEIVSVAGSSEAQLTLAKPVVAGAYEYSLYQHSDGNWYLNRRPRHLSIQQMIPMTEIIPTTVAIPTMAVTLIMAVTVTMAAIPTMAATAAAMITATVVIIPITAAAIPQHQK